MKISTFSKTAKTSTWYGVDNIEGAPNAHWSTVFEQNDQRSFRNGRRIFRLSTFQPKQTDRRYIERRFIFLRKTGWDQYLWQTLLSLGPV